MKEIKLTGREISVLRVLDFATGTPARELADAARLPEEDFIDVVNGLVEVGYVEVVPASEKLTPEMMPDAVIDVNPSYAQQLREAMYRKSRA